MMGIQLKKLKIYPWVVVGLLWIVAFLNYMDRQMLSTMRGPMMIDITELQSAANFGRLMAVFLWIYALMSPISGIIADRVNRKWLIVGSLAVWSFVTYLMGEVSEFRYLYILRGIMGVSEALYLPAALSLIADYHKDKTRSLAIGIHMTGLYAGQAIGGFGAAFAALYTWNFTFQAFGMVGVLYSIVLIFFLRDIKKETVLKQESKIKIPISKTLVILLCNTSFWVILLYFCIPSLPGWATKNWLPTLFSQSLGIDMISAGPMSTITIAVSSFVGVICGGFLSDRWLQKNLRGRVYTGAIGLSLTIPSLFLIGFGSTLLPIVSGAILFGLGFGMFDANNMPILCQFVSSKYRGTAYGIMNLCGVTAGAFITDILGKSTDAGNLGRDFAYMAIVVFVVILVQLTFLRPTTKDMTD